MNKCLSAHGEFAKSYRKDHQDPEEIQQFLLTDLCGENPYKPLSRNEILSELEQSQACYERGEGEDFDKAVDEMGAQYGL